eukprot:453713_1
MTCLNKRFCPDYPKHEWGIYRHALQLLIFAVSQCSYWMAAAAALNLRQEATGAIFVVKLNEWQSYAVLTALIVLFILFCIDCYIEFYFEPISSTWSIIYFIFIFILTSFELQYYGSSLKRIEPNELEYYGSYSRNWFIVMTIFSFLQIIPNIIFCIGGAWKKFVLNEHDHDSDVSCTDSSDEIFVHVKQQKTL